MTSTLTMAKDELFRRAPEEHFASFTDLRDSAAKQRQRCRELEARDLNVLFGESGDVYFGDHAVRPTHYSYGQLAAVARVPMHVLERLETPTRASVMNQCYERSRRFRIGLCDGDSLRAVTSDRYERVWDEELLDLLDRWLVPSGFVPAVPTGGGGNAKGNDKPALFRSDRDSFAFFYSEKTPHDPYGGLRKGVMVFNSEVGAKCLGYATFLFRDVCSNFMVWGVGQYAERTARHVGQVREVFTAFDQDLRKISNEMTPEEVRIIEAAAKRPFTSGFDPETAQDRLFDEFHVPRRLASQVVDEALKPHNPGELTSWGVGNGLPRRTMTTIGHNDVGANDRAKSANFWAEFERRHDGPPDPFDPGPMTPDERLGEIGRILAAGYLRLRDRRRTDSGTSAPSQGTALTPTERMERDTWTTVTHEADGGVTITTTIHLKKGPKGQKVLCHGPPPARRQKPPRVLQVLELAARFERLLQSGAVKNQAEIADLAGVSRARITQVLALHRRLASDVKAELRARCLDSSSRCAITEHELRPLFQLTDPAAQWAALREILERKSRRGAATDARQP
jgi:hypothetical protein